MTATRRNSAPSAKPSPAEAVGVDLSQAAGRNHLGLGPGAHSPRTRFSCSATRTSAPPNSPPSAAASARRVCTRCSSTGTPIVRKSPGLPTSRRTARSTGTALKRATDWRANSTYEDHLPLLAILHAKEVPSEKGGTMFADMRAAYDALPEQRKQQLEGLTALHGRSIGPAGEKLYGDDKGVTGKLPENVQLAAVTRHPVTDRQILFVNPMHTYGFVGMPRDAAGP